jgi:hypothetical protein
MRRPYEAIVCNAFEAKSSGEVRLDHGKTGILWRAAQHFGSPKRPCAQPRGFSLAANAKLEQTELPV